MQYEPLRDIHAPFTLYLRLSICCIQLGVRKCAYNTSDDGSGGEKFFQSGRSKVLESPDIDLIAVISPESRLVRVIILMAATTTTTTTSILASWLLQTNTRCPSSYREAFWRNQTLAGTRLLCGTSFRTTD
jgi:hypothetical protein